MIIDIEGTDGSGKKTQTDLLYEFLIKQGYRCLKISFPNYDSDSSAPVKMYLGGLIGDKANCLNAYQASVVFAVDRLLTIKQLDLANYDYVLMDRYVPSNIIHQSTKVEDSDLDRFIEWVKDFEYKKLDLPVPDKIIFLDMPIEISTRLARSRQDLKNKQKQDIHEKDDNHLILAYNRAKYIAKIDNWIHIDCATENNPKSIEEIHDEILTNLEFNDTILNQKG